MDSSKSTFEGAGHGQWRWPRTWPLNSRGLVCTAPEGAQSLPGSLSRVLLGCRHSSDLSIGPGKGRPAEGDSRMRGACRAHACKGARFPSGAEFSPSAAPRTCRAAAVNARGAARWPGRALAQRGQHASRRGANLQCTAAHGTERGDRESAPRPVRAAGK